MTEKHPPLRRRKSRTATHTSPRREPSEALAVTPPRSFAALSPSALAPLTPRSGSNSPTTLLHTARCPRCGSVGVEDQLATLVRGLEADNSRKSRQMCDWRDGLRVLEERMRVLRDVEQQLQEARKRIRHLEKVQQTAYLPPVQVPAPQVPTRSAATATDPQPPVQHASTSPCTAAAVDAFASTDPPDRVDASTATDPDLPSAAATAPPAEQLPDRNRLDASSAFSSPSRTRHTVDEYIKNQLSPEKQASLLELDMQLDALLEDAHELCGTFEDPSDEYS